MPIKSATNEKPALKDLTEDERTMIGKIDSNIFWRSTEFPQGVRVEGWKTQRSDESEK